MDGARRNNRVPSGRQLAYRPARRCGIRITDHMHVDHAWPRATRPAAVPPPQQQAPPPIPLASTLGCAHIMSRFTGGRRACSGGVRHHRASISVCSCTHSSRASAAGGRLEEYRGRNGGVYVTVRGLRTPGHDEC